jgi:ribulose-5-phosphate 4-epimerase/fuculose-1-phosphate aldolase
MNVMTKPSTAAGPLSEVERNLRRDLAAFYRIVAMNDWADLLTAHISARSPDDPDHTIMHPSHLLFEEMKASSFHKLDKNCEHVNLSDERPHSFAFPIHRAIYEAIPEAKVVVHLHTDASTAMTMLEEGLIPANQYAMWLGPVGQHNYGGLFDGPGEGERLVRSFGSGQIVLLRSHGIMLWAHSIAGAFMLTYLLNRAMEAQLAARACNVPLSIPSQEMIELTHRQAEFVRKGDNPFVVNTWKAMLRKVERLAPDYKD